MNPDPPPYLQPRDSPIVILVFFETFLYGYLLSIDLIYLIDIYYLQNIYISILCLLYICYFKNCLDNLLSLLPHLAAFCLTLPRGCIPPRSLTAGSRHWPLQWLLQVAALQSAVKGCYPLAVEYCHIVKNTEQRPAGRGLQHAVYSEGAGLQCGWGLNLH